MSNLGSIHTYRSEVDRIIRFGGSRKRDTLGQIKHCYECISHYDKVMINQISGEIISESEPSLAL
jgi:hypothetical protein